MMNPSLQTSLLAWFAANARDLPWRHTRDPYHIMVSEVMLQQTQVDRVIPKYFAFLAAFPTLEALADAPTAEVIRLWAGLGYNRRAVNLQRAARAVRDTHGGQFPRSVEGLLALPGIGPYTAGAVACFAFEQDVAFIDTNIRRVLRRALVGPDGQEPAPKERELLELGAALVPPGQGWAWNQAIMELGALICTAAAPACRRCPLSGECRAYAAWRSADEAAIMAMADAPAEARELGAAPRPARRVAERKEAPYQGSRRWYRGKIIDALRQHHSLDLNALGGLIKDNYTSENDGAWLRELVGGLAHDGLLVADGDMVSLP